MSASESQDMLHRFHSTLARALRESRAGKGGDWPVTVAEIYQDLLPYRRAREELGFAMNADYEHVLVRLLAGEDDLVRLEPPEAQRELRRALDTVDPDVGVYRRFAACDVWLSTEVPEPEPGAATAPEDEAWEPGAATEPDDEVREPGAAAAPEDEAREPGGAGKAPDDGAQWEPYREDVASAPGAGVRSSTRQPDQRASRPAGAAGPAAPGGSTGAGCAHCAVTLPADRVVRFCPHCGGEQPRPCPSCGEPVEREWRFCAACGAPVEGGGPA